MNKFKKTALAVVAAAVVAVSGAAPAMAYTTYNCYYGYRTDGGSYPGTKVKYCYYDYNWWEESWAGGSHRDGWYYTHVPIYT